jgi:hypothetical protein
MVDRDNQAAFQKELQAKVEKKLRENEISLLEYWRAHLDRVVALRPEGIAPLQLQVKKISDMMENRIKMLKKG